MSEIGRQRGCRGIARSRRLDPHGKNDSSCSISRSFRVLVAPIRDLTLLRTFGSQDADAFGKRDDRQLDSDGQIPPTMRIRIELAAVRVAVDRLGSEYRR